MTNFLLACFVALSVLSSAALAHVQFRVIRQWRYLNYTWPSAEALQSAEASGAYIPENVLTAGIVYYDDWYYMTMPRMKNGVPATLGRIPATSGGSTAPLISPFPSWEYNKIDDCNALQNVQNIEIDSKGQMWIIDGGHTASLTSAPVKNCSPKLVIFDIKLNATTTMYTFPESVANRNGSFLYDIVVDDDFAYITDNSGHDPGIIVFSRQQNLAWKIRHSKTMRADPSAQNFRVNDVPISSPINVAGIALGTRTHNTSAGIVIDEDREVFYCPLSSLHLYSISASVLRNMSNSNGGMDFPGEVKDVGLKASQTDGMIMSSTGTLYYGLLGDNSIARWDSRTPFASGQKVVSRDFNYIQWTNSFTIDLQGNLTVLTNTLQKFVYKNLDVSQYNFWLLSAQVGEKSYVHEEPSYDANPEPKEEPNPSTTASTARPHLESRPPSTSTSAPKPAFSSEANGKHPESDVNSTVSSNKLDSPGAGSRQGLGLCVIVASVTVWLLNNMNTKVFEC